VKTCRKGHPGGDEDTVPVKADKLDHLEDLGIILPFEGGGDPTGGIHLGCRFEAGEDHPDKGQDHRQADGDEDDVQPEGAGKNRYLISQPSVGDVAVTEFPVDHREDEDHEEEDPGDGRGVAETAGFKTFLVNVVAQGGGGPGGSTPVMVRAISKPPWRP
jgi:hypothetical protein